MTPLCLLSADKIVVMKIFLPWLIKNAPACWYWLSESDLKFNLKSAACRLRNP